MRPTGCTAVRKGLQRLEKQRLIEGFEAENQHRADGKAWKVYAAITVRLWTQQQQDLQKAVSEASRGDINVSVSHWEESASSLDSSNGTTNGTTPSVPFDSVTQPASGHPFTDRVEEVHPHRMGQGQAVPFKEPSHSKGSDEWDNSGGESRGASFWEHLVPGATRRVHSLSGRSWPCVCAGFTDSLYYFFLERLKVSCLAF